MLKNYSDKANDAYYSDNKHYNKDKKNKISKRNEPVFSLKVDEDQKTKDWYVNYMEYVIPAYSSVIDNFDEMKTYYEVLNNNLSGFKKLLDNFVNPMGENVGQIEEELIPYPKLHTKINVLKGELLKKNDNFKVILLSAHAVRDKNEALVEAIKASVEEQVLLEIERVQAELEGMSREEANAYIENLRTQKMPEDIVNKNWKSEWEIFYNKALKYCYHTEDIKTKRMDTFTDVIVADRCFIYSGWRYGKPYCEVRNTLFTGFLKSTNERYVNKGDYVWYKKPITIADVYNNYGHLLTQDEIESLGIYTYSNNQRVDKRHDIFDRKTSRAVFDHTNEQIFRANKNRNSFEDKTIGTSQGQGINNRYNKEDLIWETHFEFKAFRKVIFLSYDDDYNERITVMLSDKFKIPKDATEIEFTNRYGDKAKKYVWINETGIEYEAEIVHVPRKYEVIRLGSDIYPVFREVPFQHTSIESPYSSFNLSTFGSIFTARNAKSVSLLQRALPAYFQYIYVKHIQNRELAKYQGYIQNIDVDQIPTALGQDINGDLIKDPIAVHALYMKKTGRNYYSGSQTTIGSLPPATRSPGSTGFILGTAQDIFNLQNLLEMLNVEIGLAMGISPQREAMFSSDSNVGDNRQAIAQSHHITEPYFYEHDEVWRMFFNDYLINFRTYCENIFKNNPKLKEHSFHYILPDGTEELLKVTPSMLKHIDIGLFASNAGADQQYLDTMLQLSHAFAQNAGEGLETISALVKSITMGSSPEEVHKMIQIEVKKQQDRIDQMNKQQQQAELEKVREENRIREDFQQHEIDKIVLENTMDKDTKVTVEEIKQQNSNQSTTD